MTSLPSLAALAAGCAALLGGPQDQGDVPGDAPPAAGVPELRLWRTAVGALPAGEGPRAAVFALRSERPRALCLSLAALDFDPRLEVCGEDGALVAADEDSGYSRGAWLRVELRAGERYAVAVLAQDGGAGEFALSALPAAAGAAPGAPGDGATLWFYERAAEREEANGNLDLAFRFAATAGAGRLDAGFPERAGEALARARSLAERLDPDAEHLQLRLKLAEARRRAGAPDDALGVLDGVAPAELSTDAARLALLMTRARALSLAQRHPEALDALASLAEVAEATGVTAVLALAHVYESDALSASGDEEGAERALREATALLDGAIRPLDLFASLVGELARAYAQHAAPREAEALLRRGLAASTDVDGETRLRSALGEVLIELGRYAEARAQLEAALEASRASPTAGVVERARLALAQLHLRLGEGTRVRELVAARIDDAPPGHEAWRTLRAAGRTLLGYVAEGEGRLQEAAALYAEAAEVSAACGEERPRAAALVNLGRVERRLGRVPAAVAHFEEAARLARAVADPRYSAFAALGMAAAALDRGRHAAAAEGARAALAELERLELAEPSLAGWILVGRAAVAREDVPAAREALARAEALLDDGAALDVAGVAGFRARFADLGEIAQDVTSLELGALAPDDAARGAVRRAGAARVATWKARALLEGVEARRAPAERPEQDFERRLATVAAALGDERALVEYAAGEDELFAYRLHRGELRRFALGPRRPVEAALEAYLARISDAERLGTPAQLAAGGHDLYERLLAPVAGELLGSLTGLVVVPTARLTQLPFEALVVERAEEPPGTCAELHYLLDACAVTYAPSVSVLAELLERPDPAKERPALLLGDPIYALDARAVPASFARGERGELPRLPRSREEVLGVAELLLDGRGEAAREGVLELFGVRRGRADRLATPWFDLRLGAEASLGGLRQDLRRFGVLHLAAHGLVDRRDPRASGIVLSPDDSGDGFWSVPDILRSELDAELVVLSACETARGRVLRGEGVQSVANAFLQAGARTVVASLWPVLDDETHDVMRAFYRALLTDGREPADALHEAKLALRRSRSTARGVDPTSGAKLGELEAGHPFVWAPFVSIGSFGGRRGGKR